MRLRALPIPLLMAAVLLGASLARSALAQTGGGPRTLVYNASSPVGATPGSIAGSTAVPDPLGYHPAAHNYTICWTVSNASPDEEWLDLVEIGYPAGWTVTAMSDLPGAHDAGPHNWVQQGIGSTQARWVDADGGLGEQYGASDHRFCTELDIPAGSAGPQTASVHLSGDDWADPPHDVTLNVSLPQLPPGVVLYPSAQEIVACPRSSYAFEAQELALCNYTGASGTFGVTCNSTWFPGSCPAQTVTVASGACQPLSDIAVEPACVASGSDSELRITAAGGGFTGSAVIRHTVLRTRWEPARYVPSGAQRTDPIVIAWRDASGLLAAQAGSDVTFLFGGYDAALGGCQTSLLYYDHGRRAWFPEPGTPGTGPCMAGDGVVLGNWLYAAGGATNGGDADLYAFDIAHAAWHTAAPPASMGSYGDVVSDGNALYFLVGFDGSMERSNQFWRYTPPAGGGPDGAWERLADVPYAAVWRAAWYRNGKVYTAGGQTEAGSLNSAAVYDISTGAWSTAPGQFAPLPSANAAGADAVLPSGQFVWAGGIDADRAFWLYNPSNNTWSQGDPLPQASARAEGDVQDGVYIHVSGWDFDGYFNGVNTAWRWISCAGCQDTRPDLGDAPDSSNHFAGAPMTAYPKAGPRVAGYSIDAAYPTVFDPAAAAAGSPSALAQGPRHQNPKAGIFLGQKAGGEDEADRGFDYDFYHNLEPQGNAGDALNGFAAWPANAADLDDRPPSLSALDSDDTFQYKPNGVDEIGLPDNSDLRHCQLSGFTYSLTRPSSGAATQAYVNVLFDWNRDGDFEDSVSCGSGQVAGEWAVQNQLASNSGVGAWTVTTPQFLAYFPTYPGVAALPESYPLWMRITVGPAPLEEALAPWFGQGPAAGFSAGETEDYLLTFPTPAFAGFSAEASLGHAADGSIITYELTVSNSGSVPARDVRVDSPVPLGADCYSPASNCAAQTTSGAAAYSAGADRVTWLPGEIAPGQTARLTFKVQVDVYRRLQEDPAPDDPDLALCNGVDSVDVVETAVLGYGPVQDAAGGLLGYVDVELASASTHVYCQQALYDLGDAPDSTNHGNGSTHTVNAPMNAYGGVAGNYPTVYSPYAASDAGPRHSLARFDAWLGYDASLELEADAGFAANADEDGWDGRDYSLPAATGCQWELDMGGNLPGDAFNLNPALAQAGSGSARYAADMDCFDDGLREPLDLPNCQTSSIEYSVTVLGPQQSRYVNAWFDWNRDGDWGDTITCGPGQPTAPEWAIANDMIQVGQGSYTFNSGNPVRAAHPAGIDKALWVRVTLSNEPLSAPNSNGSGPAGGYVYGETEDYYLVYADSRFYYSPIPTAVQMNSFAAGPGRPVAPALSGWPWAALASLAALALARRAAGRAAP